MQLQQVLPISSFQKNSQTAGSVASQAPASFSSASLSSASPAAASSSALEIHARALDVSTRYKRAEAELLEVLDQVDRQRVFLQWVATSLYGYCVGVLKLSESVTYNLIAVMRKSREVPELREQSKAGTITLSNARRVAAVLTPENKREWLERASQMSSRQLEKEISKVLPGAATREHVTYVTPDRIKLELGLSESEMLKFRKLQDQVSQARQASVSLEDTLIELMNFYLARKCPLERARRHAVKKGLVLSAAAPGHNPAPGHDPAPEVTVCPEAALPARASDRAEVPARKSNTKCDTQVLGPQQDAAPSAEPKPKYTRTQIPTKILQAVNLRDERKCQYRLKSGSQLSAAAMKPEKITDRNSETHSIENSDRCEKAANKTRTPGMLAPICGQTRFLEVHHRIPISEGGTHTVDNLITLCAHHHEWIHRAIVRQHESERTGMFKDTTPR